MSPDDTDSYEFQTPPEDVDEFEFRVESRLMSHGVYVDDVTVAQESYRIRYESMAADEGVIPHREVGRVINVVRDLHPDDWQGVALEGEVTDLEGTVLGHWHVERDWIAALHDGDLTEVEFSERVIETVEPVDPR
jgi:hypothetical protein